MTAVKEPKPKSAAGVGALLRAPQAAWRWGQAHPTAGISASFALLAAIMPLLAVWVMRPSPPKPQPITLARALAELDKDHDDSARQMSEQLTQDGGLAEGEAGGPAFVLGVITSRQADGQKDEHQRRFSLLAARYFFESRELGFPEGREPEGLWLLGKNLYRAGQLEASQEALEAALPLNSDAGVEIHRMLCSVYLNQAPPKLDQALEHITACLKDATLTPQERAAAQLERAAILLRQGRSAESRAALAEVPADSAQHVEGQILAARILFAEANELRRDAAKAPSAEAIEKYEAAAGQLEKLAESLPANDNRQAAAFYHLGVCYQSAGRVAEARQQYLKVRGTFPSSLEAMAAGMQEADLLREEHRDEEAVEFYHRLLGSFRGTESHAYPWLALDELRQRSLGAYQRYFDAGQFELALKLLEALTRLLDAPTRLELSAAARRAWGQALLAETEPSIQCETRQQAEGLLRAAGRDFARLAELRFTTREYPDDVWASADCFQSAHDYAAARRMLATYLKHEPANRRPLALVRLGECLLMANRPTEALAQFEEALTTAPADSAAYRGRILASQAHLQLDDTAAAEKLLLENIESDLLTPASLEWRDSLFALGKLLYLTNRYAEALPRLEEAVRRYPQSSEALNARYLIGESYRQQARAALDQRDAALVESARTVHAREARLLLEAAIAAYDAADASLESRRDLSPRDAGVQRNCRYMKAAALFDMGRYEESIKTYSTAINQYQHAPEVLDAYVRVADCFRRLKRPLEARGTIEQAKVVLGRLPDGVDFKQTSSLDRQEWQRYLEWLGAL